jgi:hypothetical protein
MILTSENFIQFAMNCYDNPQCVNVKEFESDIKRFKFLNSLFTKYGNGAVLRERLILNHIIILYNVFGTNATYMLFHKIDSAYWSQLTTFLIYLNHMPEKVNGINQVDISLDQNIIDVLRKL